MRRVSVAFTVLVVLLLVQQQRCELDFVIEIFRHGARGPTSNYWNGGQQGPTKGQLTPTGMRQQEVLGQTLRKEYIENQKLLSPNYNYSEMYIFSDDYDRTITSAFSQLYGLYPPGTGPKIDPDLQHNYLLPPYKGVFYQDEGQFAVPDGYSPITVHSSPRNQDPIINSMNQCPNIYVYGIEYILKNLPQILGYWEMFEPTIQEVQKMLNISFLPLWEMNQVWSVFECDLYNGWPLPPNFTIQSQLWNNISFMNNITAYLFTQNMTLYNIVNNNIFTLWIDSLDAAIAGNNGGLKFMMFSAHDMNLIEILPSLNITNAECLWQLYFTNKTSYANCWGFPQFASNLILELYNKTNIKIKYNGVYQKLCESNSTVCSYEEFRSRIKLGLYSPTNYQQICKGKLDDLEQYKDYAHVQTYEQFQEYLFKIFSSKLSIQAHTLDQEPETTNHNSLFTWIILAQALVLASLVYFSFKKSNPKQFKAQQVNQAAYVLQ